jgi:hypothetical protein
LGLAHEVSISRNSSESDGYGSETRVEFSEENGPWDLLEFPVTRQGKLLVSVEDVNKWLPHAFDSVVARRQEEAGDRPTR